MSAATGSADIPLRILLAEDDRVHRTMISRRLEGWGHEVVSVTDGAQAVRACEEIVFDVVVMDADMPVMNGIEATRQIRELERRTGTHMPILALTACALDGDRERLLAAGMDAYLSKPMHGVDLFKVLESVADRKHTMQAAQSIPPQVPAVLDPGIIREQIGDDTEFLREIVEGYRAQRDELMFAIRSCVLRRDAAGLAGTAHKLKGSLLTLGACQAVDAARRLEYAGKVSDFESAGPLLAELMREMDEHDVAIDALLMRGLAA